MDHPDDAVTINPILALGIDFGRHGVPFTTNSRLPHGGSGTLRRPDFKGFPVLVRADSTKPKESGQLGEGTRESRTTLLNLGSLKTCPPEHRIKE